MEHIELREGDFNAFFEAPFACYGNQTRFVSPMRGDLKKALDDRRNPLFRDFARRALFTAHRAGKPVGRILAHIHDASNRRFSQSRGYFGLFECLDEEMIARALLDRASAWLRERGCDEIVGGFNLTITQMIGIVTEGFERDAFSYQEYTLPHIARLLRACGFEAYFPMRTYSLNVREADPDKVLADKQRALLADSSWRFVPMRRRELKQRLLEACSVLNDGFADNAMFVPMTQEEFLFPCDGLMWVIDEGLSCTAYHHGEAVGALLCIPDLNPFLRATDFRLKWSTPWHLLRFRQQRARAAGVFFSVRQAYHNRGVNAVMLYQVLSYMKQAGYTELGMSWVSDSNAASLRQMEKLGAKPLHRLHLFRKTLA